MKRNVLIFFSLLAVISLGCAANTLTVSPEYPLIHQGGRGQGFRTHMHYYVPYSCSREGTGLCKPGVVTGVIRQMSLEKSKFEAYPGLTAEIQTLDKELVHVHIAPEWFLARHQRCFATRRTRWARGSSLAARQVWSNRSSFRGLRSGGQAQRALHRDLPITEGFVGENLRLLGHCL